MSKTKVCIYTRVSTSMQIDGYSLDAQKSRMKASCEYNNYEIAGEYEDAGKSGKSIEGRAAFNRMLEDIKSGKDEEGRKVGISTENVRVTNCQFKSGFGVVVGSEMSGSVRNVLVQDCVFENKDDSPCFDRKRFHRKYGKRRSSPVEYSQGHQLVGLLSLE